MTFRKVIIFYIIALFGIFLAYYLITRYSPFDLNKIQQIIEQKQIDDTKPELLNMEIEKLKSEGLLLGYLSSMSYAAFVLLLVGISCSIIATHLAVDKLFFKKFYENPSLSNAIRRGVIIALVVGGIIAMNVLGYEAKYILIAPVVGVVIEGGVALAKRGKIKITPQS